MSDKTTAGARKAALDFMRDRAAGAGQPASARAARLASVTHAPRFEDLPQYRQILAQEAARDQLGMESPFYRAHDEAAGATTRIEGRALANFASYDYLGLNQHPAPRAAAQAAIERYGISASASRVVAGERPVHAELEGEIASFYGVEDAVVFVSGYLTNMTVLPTLVGAQDLILHDELIHNSVLAGAQFSGAARRSFRHNDIEDLERQLQALSPRHRHVLVVVEGLYSMDGDLADLPALVALKRRYGFWLMVDEAHGLGVLGRTGRGSHEHFGVDPREVDIWMGTLSKTTASCGGYIAGSAALARLLKGNAGGFIYSVGLAPALAASAAEAIRTMRAEPERVARLQKNGLYFRQAARAAGLDTGLSEGFAVTPVMVGDSVRAAVLSGELIKAGINALPIIFPAVPEGQARLRFFITSEHTPNQMDRAVALTAGLLAGLATRGVGIGSIDSAAIARSLAGQ